MHSLHMMPNHLLVNDLRPFVAFGSSFSSSSFSVSCSVCGFNFYVCFYFVFFFSFFPFFIFSCTGSLNQPHAGVGRSVCWLAMVVLYDYSFWIRRTAGEESRSWRATLLRLHGAHAQSRAAQASPERGEGRIACKMSSGPQKFAYST